ncbi:D-mannose binding lectin [Andreprevotia lacus DSM 23236]|uniref:D-mannose binding lectin n=1 Tax=Andreprevotia lacus DSM 23236 TaxID=1121001 RepID=A0A1W1WZE5_9NEIS|nr:lectin [Andreprevotia lacus]SMC17106.1 D-mannose binding lectin [Andreprevotia lacus DSM 23236]
MAYKGTTLLTNQFLAKEDYLLSQDQRHQLILQDDGNLVLYRLTDHRPIWASGTNGKAVSKAIMQQDGNFVIYGYPDALWSSRTNGKPNSTLIVQNDGNVVVYEPSVPVWATNTAGQ